MARRSNWQHDNEGWEDGSYGGWDANSEGWGVHPGSAASAEGDEGDSHWDGRPDKLPLEQLLRLEQRLAQSTNES